MSIKMVNKLSLIVLLWVLCLQGFGQKVSNKGREFWVGYGHHQYMETGTNTQNMVLYLSAESQPAIVTVTLDSSGFTPALWYKKTYNIPANTVIATEYLPKGTINAAASGTNPNFDSRLYTDPPPFGTGGEGIFRKKGIHIESNVDIVAYAHIFGSVSSGATVLLPVKSWGFAYTSVNSEQIDAAGPGYTWAYVIAKDNNTRIKVTPSVTTRLGKPAGTAVTVDLQKGQIYQIIGQSDPSGNGNQFTGSKIESIVGSDGQCHLIAAFSGSSRTRGESVPCGSGSGRDNDMQQMFADQTWGKRYLTAPFSTASGSSANPTLNASTFMTHVYKIVIKEPNTIVKRNGTVLTGYNGLYYQFSSNTADYIEADKPIMVAQFMSGSSTCNPGSYGDPEMVFLTPIEQAIPKVGFYRNNVESIYANYVTLIVPTPGLPSLKIDNSSVFNYTYTHPNLAGYTVVVKGWKAAPAQATIVCDSGFNAITYGLGGAESYAYIAGAFFENLNAISGLTNNPGVDTTNKLNTFNCVNTPVQLSVLIRYKPNDLTIQMDSVGNKVTPNAVVTLNPASTYYVDSVTVKGQGYYQYALPGTYLFNTAGTYTIPVIATRYATGLCIDREEIPLTVVIKPKATSDFSFVVPGCPSDSVKFTADTSGGGYTISKFAWEFPVGTPHADSSRVTGKIFPGPGNYNVKLTSFTKDACNADTIKTIVIGPGPTTTFSVAPTTVCDGQAVTITPGTTTATEWIWDFGDGNIDTLTSGSPFTYTYSTYGTYSIGHSINNGSSCKPSATPVVVNVNANPFATFTFPAGCLPTSGIAQFNSTAFTSDGKAITTHSWNFGDPGSGVNNTSTAGSPTHTYALGSYTITYRAETANGCFKDTTVSTTFNVKPSVIFTALTALCDSSAPISIANGSVTNGVPGTGIYKGPGIIDPNVGTFDPANAGVGTHTLWYVFTSTTGNCQDSQSQNITVKPLPVAGFSYPLGCLPNSTMAFTDTSKIPVGLTATYGWNFGEPSSGANNISSVQNPSHSYAAGGSYLVNLIVNLNGCSDTATITVPVKVQPQLSYPVLPGVCGTLAPLSVASAVVTNGVPGAGIYKGPGITNSNGTFDPSIAGVGSHQIWFVYTATDGCIDSVPTTISVGPPPTASFTYPLSCLTNGNVQFTSNSTIPAGPAPVYAWDFGDPLSGGNNISGAQNPIHSYPNDSIRIVKLTVTVSGCSDDTTINVPVRIQPIINFPIQTDVCLNVPPYTITLATITNSIGGNGKYAGNGITDTIVGTFNPAIAGVGPHTITYTYSSLRGCTASVNATIIVKAIPFASFTFPTTCLPNGNVQFTNSSTGASTYVWDFGDASATSTSTSPLHLYAGSGPFNVKLTSTSNGCSKDTTIAVLVKVQPQISFPIQAGVCLNAPPFGIAQATITNGVTGTGKYTGPGITDTIVGTFNPAIAGVGTQNITFSFVSALGCSATASTTIIVKAIPFASFTFPTTCLIDGNVQFTNSSTGATTHVWDFGDASATSSSTSPSHLYAGAGPFNVKLTSTSNGCSKDTTIAVLVKVQPQISFPLQAGVCLNAPPFGLAQATITNGVIGTGKYTGPGITDTLVGTFNPSIAGIGTHVITYGFVSALGCSATANSTVIVKAIPFASFTFPTTCLPNGNVQFTNGSTGASTYVWDFGDGTATSISTAPSHLYAGSGPFNVKLTSTSNGCSKDTTIAVLVKVQPQLNFPAQASVCLNSTILNVAPASVINGVPGVGKYSGNGITDTLNGIFNPSLAGVGTHQITYTFTTSLGCIATTTSSIVVKSVPVASFTYPTGCLPNGLVQFNNISSGSLGGTYSWNFGDPGSGANNTSTFTNPQHSYSTFGSYSIKLTATLNGCSDDTTITTTFALQPQLSYPRLPSVCAGSAPTSVASAFVTNGVVGTGTYSGTGVDASGIFNPVVAGVGTHIITYSFVSTIGSCATSIPRSIIVNPVPLSSFSVTDSICANTSSLISNSSTIASGNIVTWLWNIDGRDSTRISGLPFSINFPSDGNHDVTLKVVSDSGCLSAAVIKTIHVGPIPTAAFVSPVEICMPNGKVEFLNASTISDNTPLAYSWNFGDGSPMDVSVNPQHTFNIGGDTVFVKLKATSVFKCSNSDTNAIVFRKKPYVNFIPQFDTLCQGQQVIFFALSNPPAESTISSYTWDFGDGGSTSNDTNAVKIFNNYGDYSIKLTVTTNNGCVGDTSKIIRVNLQPKIDAGYSVYAHLNELVTFNPIINSPNVSFNWTPSTGLNSTTAIRPSVKASATQTYTLTATAPGGCTAVDSLTVFLMNQISIPNAFSPNGDGINDRWEIGNLVDYPKNTVDVYNRFGRLVYRSAGLTRAWNGKSEGKELPVGTYYYVINLNDETKPITGYVVILK